MLDSTKCLDDVLDFSAFDEVRPWVDKRLRLIRNASADELLASELLSVEAPDAETFQLPLGPYSSPVWRRFALAAFLADWACYPKSADRADFPRLLSVMATFPAGFRVWMCRLQNGQHVPVGYTGWYPISRNVFDLLYLNPIAITHRGFMVSLHALEPAGNYLYLFNYSIVPQLHRTSHSALLVKTMAETVARTKSLGLAAVTVSEDGARVARRFGLERRGEMYFEGEAEQVYAVQTDGGGS